MTFTWNALSATRPSANQPLGIHVVSYGLYLREIVRLVASGGLALPGQRFVPVRSAPGEAGLEGRLAGVYNQDVAEEGGVGGAAVQRVKKRWVGTLSRKVQSVTGTHARLRQSTEGSEGT